MAVEVTQSANVTVSVNARRKTGGDRLDHRGVVDTPASALEGKNRDQGF
jgi:hypothetical protein